MGRRGRRRSRASRASRPTSASTRARRSSFKIETACHRLPHRHLPPRLLRRPRRAQGRDASSRRRTLPQTQPACLDDPTTGLVDCGNWGVSASWDVPVDRRRRASTSRSSCARTPTTAARVTSSSSCATTTSDSEICCSRPPTRPGRRTTPTAATASTRASPAGPRLQGQLQPAVHDALLRLPAGSTRLRSSTPSTRWCAGSKRNGYDVSYTTGVDTDRARRRAARAQGLPVGRPRRVLVGGAARQRRGGARRGREPRVLQRQRGVLEDALGAEHRRLGDRRTARSSATRRRTPTRRSIPIRRVDGHVARSALQPAGRRRPAGERADRHDLHGERRSATTRSRCPRPTARLRFWRNTGVADARAGADGDRCRPARSATSGTRTSTTASGRPGSIRLSTTTVSGVPQYLQDYGSTYAPGTATHHLTLYRARERRARVRCRHGAVVVGARRRARRGGCSRPTRGCSRRPSTCSPTWACSRRRCRRVSSLRTPLERLKRAGVDHHVAGERRDRRRHDQRDGHGSRRRRAGRRGRGLDRRRSDLASRDRPQQLDLRVHARGARARSRSARARSTTAATSRRPGRGSA